MNIEKPVFRYDFLEEVEESEEFDVVEYVAELLYENGITGSELRWHWREIAASMDQLTSDNYGAPSATC